MTLVDLQRRRKQERIYDETQAFLSQHHNTERLHDWENKTQQAIERRQVENIKQQLLQKDNDELDERKKNLQSLYSSEMTDWEQTIQSSREISQEDRINQIRDRAYMLKDQREKERQQFVSECYERQWANACEELRILESKQVLNKLTKDRALLIKQKERIAEQKQQAMEFEDTAAMCLLQKDESYEQEVKRQQALEFKRSLNHQIMMKERKTKRETLQTRQEEQQQLQQLALLERSAREDNIALHEKAKNSGNKILEETMLRAIERDKARLETRKQNLILLKHAMNIERQQINDENLRKLEGKDAAQEYVQSLREQAKVEEKENETINMIRNQELDKHNQKKDAEQKAEAEKRRIWQQEVDMSRQEQIHRKNAQAIAIRKEIDIEVEAAAAARRQADEEDKRDAEKAQAKRMEVYEENRRSMSLSSDKERLLAKKREQEELKNEEIEYKRRLDMHKNRCSVSDLI